jgi:hypothetical protein
MKFEDWYKRLPARAQSYVKTFAFHPTESNKGFITGYLMAVSDYETTNEGMLSFWFTWSIRVIQGTEDVKELLK